jgi:hypothetical protein
MNDNLAQARRVRDLFPLIRPHCLESASAMKSSTVRIDRDVVVQAPEPPASPNEQRRLSPAYRDAQWDCVMAVNLNSVFTTIQRSIRKTPR